MNKAITQSCWSQESLVSDRSTFLTLWLDFTTCSHAALQRHPAFILTLWGYPLKSNRPPHQLTNVLTTLFTGVCMHMWECVLRPQADAGHLPLLFSIFWDVVSHLFPSLSLPHPKFLAFRWVLGIWTQVSCLQSRHVTDWAISFPSPYFNWDSCYFKKIKKCGHRNLAPSI